MILGDMETQGRVQLHRVKLQFTLDCTSPHSQKSASITCIFTVVSESTHSRWVERPRICFESTQHKGEQTRDEIF